MDNTETASTRKNKKLLSEPETMIKENSSYVGEDGCAPDNNPFWADGHNPLSSKGN